MRNKIILFLIGLAGSLPTFSQINKIDSLKYISDNSKIDSTGILAEIEIAVIYSESLNYDSAEYYFEKAISESEKSNYWEGMYKSLYNLGLSYSYRTYYQLAEDYLKKSYDLALKNHSLFYQMQTLNTLGGIYHEKLLYNEAIAVYTKALKLAEQLNNKIHITSILNNIALIYDNLNDDEKSLSYLNRSFALSKEINFQEGIAAYYSNYGIILLKQKKYSEALHYLEKSFEIYKNIGDTYSLIICYLNLAEGYAETEQYEKAEKYYTEASKLNETAQSLYSNSAILSGLGKVYLKKKNYKKALELFNKSAEISKQFEDLTNLAEVYKIISETYNEIYNYKEALSYHIKYKEITDSINKIENEIKVKEFELIERKSIELAEIEFLKNNQILTEKHLGYEKKSKRNLLILLFVLLFIIIYFIILTYKFKTSNKKVRTINEQLKKEKELLKAIKYELKIQEEHLQSFAKNSNDFLLFRIQKVQTEKFGKIVFFGSSVKEVLGLENPKNMEEWFSKIHEGDFNRVKNASMLSGEKGITFNETFRGFHSLKNEWIWIHAIITPVFEETGDFEFYNGIAFDVTNHVKLEKALEESEYKYRYLIENLSEGIAVNDANENFLLVNRAAEKIFGVEPGELTGKNLTEFLFPGNRDLIKKKTQQRLKGKTDEYFIEIINRKDETKIINVKAFPSYNKLFEYATVAIIRDITDEKQAEVKLIHSEYNYRTLFEKNPIAMIEEDYSEIKKLLNRKKKEGVVNFKEYIEQNPEFVQYCNTLFQVKNVNEETLKLFKVLTKAEFLNNPHKFYTDVSLNFFKSVLIAFADDKVSFSGESLLKNNNGKRIDVFVKLFVVNDYRNVIVSIRDITNRKKAIKYLIDANKNAQKSNRLKSQFLANMSHEIRTPMNAIIGFSDILYNRLTNETHKSFVEKILISGNNLLKLINDILDLSKIEANELRILKKPVDLREVVDELKILFSETAKDKSLKLTASVSKELTLKIITDELRIKQILINLIGNAIKFTEKGSVSIKVSVENIDDTHINLKISVKDTGIGIPEDQLQTIFETFRQVEGQDTAEFGGTGLGLSITKSLTEMLGGKIFVKRHRIGSEFIMEFNNVEKVQRLE
jgi:PAS domain S-box-containing protein